MGLAGFNRQRLMAQETQETEEVVVEAQTEPIVKKAPQKPKKTSKKKKE